jgi:GcrA cell cycle regulator
MDDRRAYGNSGRAYDAPNGRHSARVNPKALRSVLRRNGISLRALREHAKRKEPSEGGLVVRRSTIGPSATYGAAALENLPNDACRWSLGDPADPNFTFCGAPVAGRSPYCNTHLGQAFQRGDSK